MNWLLLVIISVVTASLTRILQKILLKDKDNNPVAFAFIFGISVDLIMLVWALIDGLSFPNLVPLIPNLIAMSLLYSLGNLFLFKAFRLAEASEVLVLFASATIWSVLSAILMLGEKLTLVKLVATLLVFMGVAIVYYSRSKWKLNFGHLTALMSALCFGVAFTNDAFVVNKFQNVSSYMFITFLFPTFTVLLFQPKAVGQLKYFFKKDILIKLLLTSLVYGISAVTIFQAYKNGGEASVISPISQTSVLMTILISYFLLKEKENVLNKLVGALFIFSGVWLLK